MALAKNQNKNTLAGEKAKTSGTTNERWIPRGSKSGSSNQGGGHAKRGDRTVRAAAHR